MNQPATERIRHRGTVMTDYRILRNYIRIYQTLGETA